MQVPKFNMYNPSQDDMDQHQLSFYKVVEANLNKGNYIDVDGNISYIFVFIYDLLSRWKEDDLDHLHEFLIYLSEIYKHEKKLSDNCLHLAWNCLLGLGMYEEYLDKTEPKEVVGRRMHASNLRLNIEKQLGLPANPIDLLLMFGGRKTDFIIDNQALYRDCIIETFNAYAQENMEWFALFEEWFAHRNAKRLYPFSMWGAPLFEKECFYVAHDCSDTVKFLSKEAENKARGIAGLPKIGEGWVSETALFRKLEAEFSNTKVVQHGSPTWLGRQHFDIWFPHWKIAVEYHGRQHFEPVEFFGGQETFHKTVGLDKRKANLAQSHGVKLFIVTETDNHDDIVRKIKNIAKIRFELEDPLYIKMPEKCCEKSVITPFQEGLSMLTEQSKYQKGKSGSRGLIVTFPNGCSFSSYQDCKDATEVWVKTIEKLLAEFGVNRILQADRLARGSHSKARIVSTDPSFRDTKTREKCSTEYRENGITYFITHDYNASRKKNILESISDVLNAGLIVNVS